MCYRLMFVFSVCRLVSRRCHLISAILTLAAVAVKPLPEPDKQISHIRLFIQTFGVGLKGFNWIRIRTFGQPT